MFRNSSDAGNALCTTTTSYITSTTVPRLTYVEILVFHSYISAFSIEIYVTDTSPRGRTGDLINGFRIITQ